MLRSLYVRSLFSLLLSGLVAAGAPLTAQSTPEDVAAEYGRKFAERDYLGVAMLTHPDALAEIRELVELLVEVEPGSVDMILGMSADEVEGASSEAVFAAFFRGVFGMEPGLGELMSTLRTEELGTVQEGDTTHVVQRTWMRIDQAMGNAAEREAMGVGPTEMSQMGVTSVLPYEGELRVLLTGELKGVVQMMRGMMAGMTPAG